MNPSALLVPGQSKSDVVIQRPMDQVLISANSPQEDEFALMNMGIPSVYQGFLDPRRLPDLERLLNQEAWEPADSRWSACLEAFLSWCHAEGQSRMIVKSPNHVFRQRALATRYPRARFVWIFRSSRELWRSNLVMWQAMIERYGLWNAPISGLHDFLEKALSAYGDILEQLHREGIFRDYSVFSYESLVADPEAILHGCAEHLGLAPWETWGFAGPGRVKASPSGSRASDSASLPIPEALLARVDGLHAAILSTSGLKRNHPDRGITKPLPKV
jgi:hypothetical protein